MPVAGGGSDWRYGVLAGLGAPDTAVNLDALQWWAESEGTPSWWHNWLATTLGGYGGHDVNSAGVKAYPTLDDGIAATVATLKGSFYFRVVAALRQGTSLAAIYDAVNASPWCYGCQAGHYPVVLYNHLGGTVPTPKPPPPPPHHHGKMPPEQHRAGQWWDNMRTALHRNTAAQIGEISKLQAYIRRAKR